MKLFTMIFLVTLFVVWAGLGVLFFVAGIKLILSENPMDMAIGAALVFCSFSLIPHGDTNR